MNWKRSGEKRMAKQKPAVKVRKPPEASVDSFVAGRPNVQASKHSNARGVVARADGRELRRMTVYLPVDLAKRLAVYCAAEDRDLSEVIAEAVAARLST